MEFLKKFNFSDDDIKEIIGANCKSIINNISLNRNNIIELVEYFLEIGVNAETIKKMFIYQIGIFHKSKKELITAFDEYEMDSIIKSLNYDVNTFDMIEF